MSNKHYSEAVPLLDRVFLFDIIRGVSHVDKFPEQQSLFLELSGASREQISRLFIDTSSS